MIENKWKTKEGKIIDIKDMSDSHLRNTINLLGFRLEKLRDVWLPSFDCETEAQYYAEQEYDHIQDVICNFETKKEELVAEEKRREK